MAAYELNIKATSLNDLEQAIKDLHARFPGLEIGAEPAPVPGARRPGRPKSVATAAHPPAAGEAQAADLGAEAGSGSLEGAADGDAGALGSEAAAQAQDQGQAAAGAASAQEAAATSTQGAADDAGTGGVAGAGDGLVGGEDAGGEDGAVAGAGGETPRAATLEELKGATRELIAKTNITTAQSVYGKLGISKPGQTPEDKIPAAMAAVQRVLEAGLDAWLKEQG